MHVWIDIDNPPQVQYLTPLSRALASQGASVVITARDHGVTHELLNQSGAEFHSIGSAFGATKAAKLAGSVKRGLALASLFRGREQPDIVIASSRSSALAARWMQIRSFIVCDYEFVDLRLYRMLGATILFPDVIDTTAFLCKGFPADRLMPFRGLKEDLSFGDVSLDEIQPHAFRGVSADLVRVLFRPPAAESHYHVDRSGTVAEGLLENLASREDIVVVFTPRYGWQSQQMLRLDWRNEPVILTCPVPFIPLLTGCDLVISSGGTMLREAAYLGIPAYSTFAGERGQVDRYLASIGRIRFVDNDLEQISYAKRSSIVPLSTNRNLARDLARTILSRTS